MSRLFACIISEENSETLETVAHRFSHSIERLDDGILFDVSGLERLVGKPKIVHQKILAEMHNGQIIASLGIADTADAAILLARQQNAVEFGQIPLCDLEIEPDTLNVFTDLGLRNVNDLIAIPHDQLVGRYGQEFNKIIKVVEQRGPALIDANIKEREASRTFHLDKPVENFEQLIFVLNHELKFLLEHVEYIGFSVEHIDLLFVLKDRSERLYKIKTSFPTLERSFWLKLINLRVSLDPPQSDIVSIVTTAYFARSRPNQSGLYAVSRPEPESLLLTVNKLKKLVGEDNVGVPVLLDQRIIEPFCLDAEALPEGKASRESRSAFSPVISFSYYRPPFPAEIDVRNRILVYIKTRIFEGRIEKYSGLWKGSSQWWDRAWKTMEWDIEVENNGLYRLCKSGREWFVTGEYD